MLGQTGPLNKATGIVPSVLTVADQVSAIAETAGTFSYDETSAAEQTAFTITSATRATVGAILLDMVNVTQDTTIRVYEQIDGTNYRAFQENGWLTTDDDGVMIDGFTTYRNFRVTLQCGGGGAGSVDVPYAVV